MNARISRGSIQPGKMDEFVAATRETVESVYKKHKGFKGFLLLTDGNANEAVSISLWETAADMAAHEIGEDYQRRMAEVLPLSDGRPALEHFEVRIRA